MTSKLTDNKVTITQLKKTKIIWKNNIAFVTVQK